MRTETSKEHEALPSEKACTCLDLSAGTSGPGGSGAFRSNLNFSTEDNIRSHAKPNALQAIFRLGADDTSRPEPICDSKTPQQDGDAPERSRDWIVDAGSEFLATALLMFVGCAGAFIEMTKPSTNVYGGAAFGLGVFMCTSIFGNVSGAHMNPLVTLVNWAFAGLRWTRVLVYVVSQMLGALVGMGALYIVVPPDVQQAVGELTTPTYSACCTRPLDSMSSWSAVLAEFVVTSILLGAVAVSIDNPPPTPGLHFGMLVFGICTVEAMYTGASMNPTRTIATAVWTGVWDRFWVYVVGQLFALAFVVATFAFFRKKKQC
ncbi:aquaporin-2-like [Thrips palmi]|uniref:Aquaporin-2-like n=1 Tax=Thrips palmi TaxID=161013 RepID=A0A6P8YWZ8_THRPL|nr:aquaporin-2-like [Thrips palmi]